MGDVCDDDACNRGNQNRHGTKSANARTARKSFSFCGTIDVDVGRSAGSAAGRATRGELSKWHFSGTHTHTRAWVCWNSKIDRSEWPPAVCNSHTWLLEAFTEPPVTGYRVLRFAFVSVFASFVVVLPYSGDTHAHTNTHAPFSGILATAKQPLGGSSDCNCTRAPEASEWMNNSAKKTDKRAFETRHKGDGARSLTRTRRGALSRYLSLALFQTWLCCAAAT